MTEAVEPRRITGVIQRFLEDKDFGFIEANGKIYFFHISELDQTGLAADQPKENVKVEFEPGEGPKGLRASKVRVATQFGNDMSHVVELRVSSLTAPRELAGSIIYNITRNKTVKLMAIGHGAVAQAVKAVPIANERTIANGFLLTILPSFDTRMISQDVEDVDQREVERTLTVMQLIRNRPM